MSESTGPTASIGAAPIDGAAPAPIRPPASRLILIRHGESTWNRERRIQGQLDPPLFEQHSHGDAIVVTHGGVIQIALHRVVGRPSYGLFPFRISNGSVSIVERRNGRLVIATVNDTSHLEGTPEE